MRGVPDRPLPRGRRSPGSAWTAAPSGAVRTADFVTATRPLDQVAEAFALAASGQHVKVLLTVGER